MLFRSEKNLPANTGDMGSIPGLRRSPGEGKGYPLQYSGLENSMYYIIHGVAKSQTQLRAKQTSLTNKIERKRTGRQRWVTTTGAAPMMRILRSKRRGRPGSPSGNGRGGGGARQRRGRSRLQLNSASAGPKPGCHQLSDGQAPLCFLRRTQLRVAVPAHLTTVDLSMSRTTTIRTPQRF